MASSGLTQEQIAKTILNPDTRRPISVGTLTQHFAYELEVALVEVAARVNETLLAKIEGRPPILDEKTGKVLVPAVQPDITAIIWWEKTRRGFKEGTVVEHTGANGGPIQHQQTVVVLPMNDRLAAKVIDATPRQLPPDARKKLEHTPTKGD